MYDILLSTHSWLRWVLLLVFILVIVKSYTGWKSNRIYTPDDKKWNTILIALVHSQLVIGLILYFTSPMMKAILSDMGGSMKDSSLRFWSVEHLFGMVLAVIIAQVGSIKAKNKTTDTGKFKTAFVYYLIALLLILLMIPFGIWNVERPLFRI
ncbi:MAG: hypothetical protein HOP11_11595 [Saprospiraceae bacterium]|nr:hypothetical protein [Saprospiraceae bacterium]